MRLTIVQYGGDYREAWERFETGGKANYQAQRYSVELVGSLAKRLEHVAIICATTEDRYDVELANGVRSIGAGLSPGFSPKALLPFLSRTAPTHLSLTTPMVPILKWAIDHEVPTLAQLADSFHTKNLLAKLRHRRLARLLNNPTVAWVGNHGIGACLSLVGIGVSGDKIVPWDWPPSHVPSDYPPRDLTTTHRAKLLYVGSVVELKGVGDLIRAVHSLRRNQLDVALTIIGKIAASPILALPERLGISEAVQFRGEVSNEDVPLAMRAADVVVIPSRHEYPEGLPLTIYEALAARTPIVASDHPMFHGAIVDNESAVIFPAGDPEALALAVEKLITDRELYRNISRNSEAAWQSLQLPVTWGDLLQKWLSGKPDATRWLWDHRLSSGRYEDQIRLRQQHNNST